MQETQENRAITINIIHNRSKAVDYEGTEKGLILIFMLGIMLCNNFPLLRHYNGTEMSLKPFSIGKTTGKYLEKYEMTS